MSTNASNLSIDRLNQSEIVYTFLSPSPNYLKQTSSTEKSKKNLRDQKFHLSTFFKTTDHDLEKVTTHFPTSFTKRVTLMY